MAERRCRVVIADARRGKETVVHVVLRCHDAGQSQRPAGDGDGRELVGPMQAKPGERAFGAAGQPKVIRSDLDGLDFLAGQFVCWLADQFAVVSPVWADAVIGWGK
jgi:hypothetical protein